MVIAFGHFLAAALGIVMASTFAVNALDVHQPGFRESDDQGTTRDAPSLTVCIIGIAVALSASGYCFVMGLGLLAAKRWAWWIAVLLCSAVCVWSLYGLIGFLWSLDRWRAGVRVGAVDVVLGALSMGIGTAPVAFAAALVAYLFRRSTRDWFRLAARLRFEHKRGFGALDRI